MEGVSVSVSVCLPLCGCLALGIILEYEHRDGTQKMKEIDLLTLTPE